MTQEDRIKSQLVRPISLDPERIRALESLRLHLVNALTEIDRCLSDLQSTA